MLDYLSYFNYLTTKLNISIFNQMQWIRLCILILMAIIGLKLLTNNSFEFKYTITKSIKSITGLLLLMLSIVLIYPSSKLIKKLDIQFQKNGDYNKVMQEKLKEYNISDNIDINTLLTTHTIYTNLPLPKNSKSIDKNKFNEFTLQATLDYMNIKSINNFALNIIYLNDYYSNHLTLENKYDWINIKLNEFYKPDNNKISDDEILKNLKN